jgi:hypothetical protein
MDGGGPSLVALLNESIGWLMYLRHADGDSGFCSRNPTFGDSDVSPDRAFVSRFEGVLVPVIEYRLANGQVDQYPAKLGIARTNK